ncbi:MAG: DUF554 family protein, partial [Anaerolineae bacterium]
KSTLDGFAALAFAASLGIGVGFSAITILLFQGSISLSAGLLRDTFAGPADPALAVLSAIGALLIIGIGLSLLEIKRVRVANFLPSLLVGLLAVVVLRALGIAGF